MKKQQGFTIIELVVVILLLGILTATALPRFMDVTDEAHGAVVNGVMAGMTSGSALYHAQWYAEGQQVDTAIAEFSSLMPNDAGWPIGANTTIDQTTDCVAIYQGLLQDGGRPTIGSITVSGTALIAGLITNATTDFTAKLDSSNNICEYAYTGQFSDAADGDVPVIQYDTDTGVIGLGTDL